MRLLGELEGPELTQEAPGPGGLSGAAGTVCACRRLLTRPRDAPCGGTLASSSPLLGPSLVTHPLWLRGLHSWQDTAPFALTAALWVCWCRRWLIFLQYLRQKQLLAQDHRGRRGLPASLSGAQFSAAPAATCRMNETWGPALGPDLGFTVQWVGVG